MKLYIYVYIYILLIIEHNWDFSLGKKDISFLCLYHIHLKQADEQPSEFWQTIQRILNIQYICLMPKNANENWRLLAGDQPHP